MFTFVKTGASHNRHYVVQLPERRHTCAACGDRYTDSEIPALGCSYSDEWSSDAANHWHECSVCGEKADKNNKSGSEEKQIGYVTLKHLRDLLSWCDNRTKSLCLLKPDDAFLLAELKRTKTEVTALINSTDFNKMVILYFAYW